MAPSGSVWQQKWSQLLLFQGADPCSLKSDGEKQEWNVISFLTPRQSNLGCRLFNCLVLHILPYYGLSKSSVSINFISTFLCMPCWKDANSAASCSYKEYQVKVNVAQRRSSFPNTLEFFIFCPSTMDNLLWFSSKIKEAGSWQANFMPRLMAGGKPSGHCSRWHFVLWVLIPIRSVSLFRVSISSSPSLIFATISFNETAETTPKTFLFLFWWWSCHILLFSLQSSLLQMQSNSRNPTIHRYCGSWDFISKTHTSYQIQRLSNTNFCFLRYYIDFLAETIFTAIFY